MFIDGWWDKDYTKNVCEAVKLNGQTPCRQEPEVIAAELRIKFVSSFQQSTECRSVNIFDGFTDPLKSTSEPAKKIVKSDWSLSFNVAIKDGEIDYPSSEWQIIDNQSWKEAGEVPGEMAE